MSTGCIQRKLDCPPITGPGAGASVVGTGANLLPAGLKSFELQGSDADKAKVSLSTVPVSGQPFTQALRAEVKQGSQNEYAVQLRAPTAAAVEEGDVLLATFYVRAEKPNEDLRAVQTQFVFELGKAPYDKSVTYDVMAGPEWREIHVPFVARRHFAAGEAQMDFRLGYDPETLDIGGITVEDFGKKVRRTALPTTKPWSPPKIVEAINLPPVEGGPLVIDVDPTKAVGPISPYVYGMNSQNSDGLGVTVRRMGGNRGSAYNWEIDASNAGSDYHHQSDDWSCSVLGYKNCAEPAAQYLDFAAEDKRLGAETIATIPMIDYVAADKNKDVSESEKAPSKRWAKSLPHKGGAYSTSPDLSDGVVYEDEFVDYLVKKLGTAKQGGIKFYSLDNEPGLWPSTHPRVHPEKTTYREMVTRTESLASAINAIDPSAELLGGVMYGWSEFLNLQDAPDAKDYSGKYDTYVDFWLSSMKELEEKHKKRLVQVLDVHWYPEARGTKRITDDDVSTKTVDARVQAPRALWDSTYREKSWIDDTWKKPIRLIPWLEEKIDKDYPGTKLSMTEYNFGAGGHISGGIAQVDALGVFGRQGLYMANYWGTTTGDGQPPPAFIRAAFMLYRNFDGKGGTYGDTAVTATTPDPVKASVFAATDSKRPRLLTIIAINKDQRARYTGKISLGGSARYTVSQVYRLDKTAPRVQPVAEKPAMSDNHFEAVLPPLSATLFVCEMW